MIIGIFLKFLYGNLMLKKTAATIVKFIDLVSMRLNKFLMKMILHEKMIKSNRFLNFLINHFVILINGFAEEFLERFKKGFNLY
jgi:hypothetical protein